MARVTKPIEERRKEIIETARELFNEKGFDKTQITDISKKMNVAQGLIYHYFKSKTDILYAVIDEMADEQASLAEKAFADMEGSVRDKLGLLFDVQPVLDNYGKLIPSLMSDSAIIEYCLKKLTVSSMPQLVSLIERGNADGSWFCEYPEVAAAFILHGISGVIGVCSPANYDENIQKALMAILSQLLSNQSSHFALVE